MHSFRTLAVTGLAAVIALPGLASAQGARASNVDRVQLAVVDSGGAACPRDATLTAWAHTSGPGTVRFVIHNSGGGKTGELQAEAIAGAAGTYLATYEHTFRVTTDVDTQYMAEASGSGESSNWVPFRATCGPQPRTGTSARGAGAQPPARTAESRARESTGTPSAGGGAPPARTAAESRPNTPEAPGGTSKPNSPAAPGGTSKPNSSPGDGGKQCGRMISSTRILAANRAWGLETAHVGWRAAVRSEYPHSWDRWDNARETSHDCTRSGVTWNCTVSARPCEP